MTDDPADGLDPEDIKELDRLFKEIVEQSGTQHEVFATDDVGLTDSVSVVVTPGTVEAKANIPTPRVLAAEGRVTAQATITGDAVALPSGVDGDKFKRMLALAGELAGSLGLSYLGNAIYDGTRDPFTAALHFVALVLTYLHPYL